MAAAVVVVAERDLRWVLGVRVGVATGKAVLRDAEGRVEQAELQDRAVVGSPPYLH